MYYKALLIDFEGTVIDFETILYQSWEKVYKIFGFTLNLDYWINNVRPHPPDKAAYYALRENLADPPTPEAVQSIQRKFEKDLLLSSTLRQGIIELIESCLYTHQLPIVLLSSSPLKKIKPVLERLNISNYFSHIITSDSVGGRKKPDPSIFNLALSLLGCRPEEVIAIEDSPEGIIGAKNARLRVVAYPNQITQHMDLTGADEIVESGTELKSLLEIHMSEPVQKEEDCPFPRELRL